MERELCLVLDKDCKIRLVLMRDDMRKLDAITSRKYDLSEEIRNDYSKSIDEFMEQYKGMIKEIEIKNKKTYRGGIVLVESQKDGTKKRVRVLYKRDMEIFKKVIKNRYFMKHIKYLDYVKRQTDNQYNMGFSDFESNVIEWERTYDKKLFENVIHKWSKRITEKENYYNIVRLILKEAQQNHEKYNFRFKEMLNDRPKAVEKTKIVEEVIKPTINPYPIFEQRDQLVQNYSKENKDDLTDLIGGASIDEYQKFESMMNPDGCDIDTSLDRYQKTMVKDNGITKKIY